MFPENALVPATVQRGEETLALRLEPIDPGTTGWEYKQPRNPDQLRSLQSSFQNNPEEEIPFPFTKIPEKCSGGGGLTKR